MPSMRRKFRHQRFKVQGIGPHNIPIEQCFKGLRCARKLARSLTRPSIFDLETGSEISIEDSEECRDGVVA